LSKLEEESNGVYFKAVYRDKRNRARLIDVFLGGGEEGSPLVSVVDEQRVVREVDKLEDYREHLQFGRRVRLEYLRNAASLDEPGAKEAVSLRDKRAEPLCAAAPQVCQTGEAVLAEEASYWQFEETGDWSRERGLAVIVVAKELYE